MLDLILIYTGLMYRCQEGARQKIDQKDECEVDLKLQAFPIRRFLRQQATPKKRIFHTKWGLVKNRYIGRTFITPGQSVREIGVKIRLNPLKRVYSGKSGVNGRRFNSERYNIQIYC